MAVDHVQVPPVLLGVMADRIVAAAAQIVAAAAQIAAAAAQIAVGLVPIAVVAAQIAAVAAQIAVAAAQIAVGLVPIAVEEDLNEAEDHRELALSVAEEDRVEPVRTVAAAAHNSELRGDSVTLISEVPAFQSSRVFEVDLLVDQHFLHCGAAARALAELVQVARFFRTYQCSPLVGRYRRMEIAEGHSEVCARQLRDCLYLGFP